ncbi:MAG: hypothetical protein E7676_06350 [Ruminococcaceae bacterium]|nr:hypothetical protein [Oscillospiraceae bacterium]
MIKRLGNDGKYGILMPECKLLYTKTAVFSDGTDLNVQTVSYEKTLCQVVRCADAQMMSSEVLKRLLLSSDTPCVSAAVAVSSFNGTIDAKAEFLYDKDPSRAIFAASVAALRATSGFSGEEVSLKISDSRFNFSHDGKNLYAFEREPNIFTFHAPDLE